MPRNNSDRRKIKDIQVVLGAHALKKMSAIQPIYFRNIDDDPNAPVSIGYIPQDFEKEFPDLVRKPKGDDGVKPIKRPKEGQGQGNPGGNPAGNPGGGGRPFLPDTGAPLDAKFTADPIEQPAASGSDDAVFDPSDNGGGFRIETYDDLVPLLQCAVAYLSEQLADAIKRIKKLEEKPVLT